MDSNTINDTFLDAAASEALGINSPMDTALLETNRAGAGEAGATLERELRETVARLSATSPHMAPPANLRGRILQATAPATFRMEDYRKATGENMRVYKWGFYAAAVFLIAAALFNISTRNQAAKTYNAYTAEVNQANALAQQVQSRNALVNLLADPRTQQVTLKDDQQNPVMRVFANPAMHQAIAIVPPGLMPEGQNVQISWDEGNTRVAFQTATLTEQGGDLKAPQGMSIPTAINIGKRSPDDSYRPLVAGMPH